MLRISSSPASLLTRPPSTVAALTAPTVECKLKREIRSSRDTDALLPHSNPFMSSPSHIQIILTEKEKAVPVASDKKVVRLNARQLARNSRLAARK